MKQNTAFLLIVVFLIFSTALLISWTKTKQTSFVSFGEPSNYKIYALEIPTQANFAGERVEINSADLKERMDKELLVNTYWQSNTLLMIKRAAKYFPIIEPILMEEGVPKDFKYLALVESGLENLTSPAGAKGFWQIMRGTGREMGLEINSNVDERYHIERATRVACKYLKKAHQELGSWTLAAASYNRGISGIQRILNTQQANNYYDLLLGTETKRYVFRILAVKAIVENPAAYGFQIKQAQRYSPLEYKTVAVDSAINNIASFAKQLGVNYKTLKYYNPWLLENHLNNKSMKLYQIALPITEGP